MADLNDRLKENVPGPYYVDASCVDCDQCRNIAPAFFTRDDEIGMSFVFQQPATPDQIAAAEEARHSCPTESIGNNGGLKLPARQPPS
jgi:ferredoxin